MQCSSGLLRFVLLFVGQALLELSEFIQCNGLFLIQNLKRQKSKSRSMTENGASYTYLLNTLHFRNVVHQHPLNTRLERDSTRLASSATAL